MIAWTAFGKLVNAVGSTPITFATELWLAGGDRGTDLLKSQALVSVRDHLDVLQNMGRQGITVAISYPL